MANDECDGRASVPVQAALSSLAEYLLLPLSAGESIIMMQEYDACRAMYVGNASGDQGTLVFHGTIAAAVARDIVTRTRTGRNRMEIAGRVFRFIRSAAYFEDRGAVVFYPT